MDDSGARYFHLSSLHLEAESENRGNSCLADHGFRDRPSMVLMSSQTSLPTPTCSSDQADGAQCFPFYTYDENGTNRRENITDWALENFRNPLPRRHHYQVGHLPLQLRTPASPRLSREIRGEPQTRFAAYSRLRKTSGDSRRQARDSQRSTSPTNPNPNTH